MPTDNPQVTGYIPEDMKDELTIMGKSKKRSVSYLITEAIEIALPELRKRYGVFSKPAQGAPGRKKNKAA